MEELKCKHCNKEIKNMFIVKDEIWEDYCKQNNISKKDIICKDCFEQRYRKIVLDDLKISSITLNNKTILRELPANFNVVKEIGDKSRIQLIKNGISPEYLNYLKNTFPNIEINSWIKVHIDTINSLKEKE